MWTPFDSLQKVWDLTQYPGGNFARISLLDYRQGEFPAPDSMRQDLPDPVLVELDTMGDGSLVWVYQYKNSFGFFADGIDFTQSFRFIGNYRPDYKVYTFPMVFGSSWITAWSWNYEIYPGITYRANESHEKRIIARGKVKVPFSGNQYLPCLVIRDYMTYSDNFGTLERRWIYEWVVPGRFCGGNGVAAAISENGAPPNFYIVEKFYKLSDLAIPGWDLTLPNFANTTVLTDTNYPGPYIISTQITDSSGIGACSLFYRIDEGNWLKVGKDSTRDSTYYWTIPQISPPAVIDYFLWAKDSFALNKTLDLWNTDPVAAPESTFFRFRVLPTAIREARGQKFEIIPTNIKIYNILGSVVAELTPPKSSMSSHNVANNTLLNLPSGIYFIEIKEPNSFLRKKVLVIR